LIRQSLIWLALPLVALILAAVAAVTLAVRAATRPVLQLQEDIRSRDGTNLAALPPHDLPTELQPIVDAVNRLFARLQRALIAERNFAAHSAHELRTPIAAARAQAQLLLDEAGSDGSKKRVRNLLDILTRLSRLVEKLLQLSRAEAGVASNGSSNLPAIVRLVVDEYGHRLTGTPAPVYLEERGPLAQTVTLDQDALGIVLHNLIDNAIAHGKPGRPISVILGPGPGLSIINEGDSIAPEELPRLRDRFARGNTQAEGSGLGLSIAEAIMRETGGTLAIHSPAIGHADGFEAVLGFRESC
jgi:two-component system OmpR family sensor kinase